MLHLKMLSVPLLSDHPFWKFSCEIYKDTKDMLLELQTHHGLNVNVILFCYWFAANYQKALSKNDIKRLLTGTHQWHENIINPLRTLRNTLQKYTDVTWVSMLRREVLDTEMLSEKIEQSLIVDMFAKEHHRVKYPNTHRAAIYAFRSIKFYCEVLYITLSERDCADLIHVAHKTFSGISEDKITALGYRLLRRPADPNAVPSKRINMELFE